jgi:hypothetical protein
LVSLFPFSKGLQSNNIKMKIPTLFSN